MHRSYVFVTLVTHTQHSCVIRKVKQIKLVNINHGSDLPIVNCCSNFVVHVSVSFTQKGKEHGISWAIFFSLARKHFRIDGEYCF